MFRSWPSASPAHNMPPHEQNTGQGQVRYERAHSLWQRLSSQPRTVKLGRVSLAVSSWTPTETAAAFPAACPPYSTFRPRVAQLAAKESKTFLAV